MLILLVGLVIFAAVYWFGVRTCFSRWGATAVEIAEPICGGSLSFLCSLRRRERSRLRAMGCGSNASSWCCVITSVLCR